MRKLSNYQEIIQDIALSGKAVDIKQKIHLDSSQVIDSLANTPTIVRNSKLTIFPAIDNELIFIDSAHYSLGLILGANDRRIIATDQLRNCGLLMMQLTDGQLFFSHIYRGFIGYGAIGLYSQIEYLLKELHNRDLWINSIVFSPAERTNYIYAENLLKSASDNYRLLPRSYQEAFALTDTKQWQITEVDFGKVKITYQGNWTDI